MSFPSCDRTVMLAAKEDSEEIDTPVIRRIWCAYRQKQEDGSYIEVRFLQDTY